MPECKNTASGYHEWREPIGKHADLPIVCIHCTHMKQEPIDNFDEILAAFWMVGNSDTDIDRKAFWNDFRDLWSDTFRYRDTRRKAQFTADRMRDKNG